MTMNELAIVWLEWRAYHGASTESIDRFANRYSNGDETLYQAIWDLLEGEQD